MITKKRILFGLLGIFLLLLAGNTLFLDYHTFFKDQAPLSLPLTITQLTPTPTPEQKIATKGASPKIVDSCYPRSCIDIIREATASIKPQVEPVTALSSSSTVREFFVHLGSGSNSTDDWADVPGVEVYIDSSKYGRIKSATFEAGIYIPTGNETAYARLFNVTDKHPVWLSEVALDGGTAKLLVSQPITLDSGEKLYRVQMKTSLKFQANLTTARVRITVE